MDDAGGGEYLNPNGGRLFYFQPTYLEQLDLTLYAFLFAMGLFSL